MTISTPAVALALALTLVPAAAQNHRKSKTSQPAIANPDVEFAGEIDRGKTYIHDIGHDLEFRLEVAPDGDSAGWEISITPKTQPVDGPIEFSAIATPPYHNFNERYIETTYNFSAQEILEMTPRRFNFVLTVDDEHRAEEAVNVMLYPNSVSEDEKQRVAMNSGNIQLGTAEFSILKSRVTSVKDPLYPGSIEWIKFGVRIKFPPALTMAQVLAPSPPDIPAPK
ncbi:MAG: hypothetical protein WB987_11290 [Candidatus Acidiferrales bacterium]